MHPAYCPLRVTLLAAARRSPPLPLLTRVPTTRRGGEECSSDARIPWKTIPVLKSPTRPALCPGPDPCSSTSAAGLRTLARAEFLELPLHQLTGFHDADDLDVRALLSNRCTDGQRTGATTFTFSMTEEGWLEGADKVEQFADCLDIAPFNWSTEGVDVSLLISTTGTW
jgi:hypothetical protein